MARYVSIWFRHLTTDWFSNRNKELRTKPFVLRSFQRGKMVITGLNHCAEQRGVVKGMPLADAKAFIPDLEVKDDRPELVIKLLNRLAEWCMRFTPVAGIDPPDGLLLDATGCTHLWGSEQSYLYDIIRRCNERGYDVRVAMADTIGASWGMARFAKNSGVVPPDKHKEALVSLPPEALRIDPEVTERLRKLGLLQLHMIIDMPRSSLRKRFGNKLLQRLDMALGHELELIQPITAKVPYQERLPCMEPVTHLKGIETAIHNLLRALCLRLMQEQKGLRTAVLKCYRNDGRILEVSIGTNRPSHHVEHLFSLFELKISSLEPGMGIELFTLDASRVEDFAEQQEKIWEGGGGLHDARLAEMLDRVSARIGTANIFRYFPDEHYWPERSVKRVTSLQENTVMGWPSGKPRPIQLLSQPVRIEVTAPIPDYPPMLFRYKGNVHKIVKADGPERIEQEWWIQEGHHRDYYCVEDEQGIRYWLFRLGHYDDKSFDWYLHGYFA